MIQANKSRSIDIREVISARLSKIQSEHMAKSDKMQPNSEVSPVKPLSNFESIQKISALSPSQAGSGQIVPETNREDNEDGNQEEEGEN